MISITAVLLAMAPYDTATTRLQTCLQVHSPAVAAGDAGDVKSGYLLLLRCQKEFDAAKRFAGVTGGAMGDPYERENAKSFVQAVVAYAVASVRFRRAIDDLGSNQPGSAR